LHSVLGKLDEAVAEQTLFEQARAFPYWNRSILTEIYLCHACSYLQEIEDGNARTGSRRCRRCVALTTARSHRCSLRAHAAW
jgi:hypothetical protein